MLHCLLHPKNLLEETLSKLAFFLDDVAIENGPAPLLDMDGAAFVIHAVADDYQTQPSGNAGARIACGVIERKPEFEIG